MNSTVYNVTATAKPFIKANGFPYSTTSDFDTDSMTDLHFVCVDLYTPEHIRTVKLELAYRLRRWTPDSHETAIYQAYHATYDLCWYNYQPCSYRMTGTDERQIKQQYPHYRLEHIRDYAIQHNTSGIWFRDDFIEEDDIVETLQDELIYSELMDETIWVDESEEITLVDHNTGRTSTDYATEPYIDQHLTRCSNCRDYQENEHITTVDRYNSVCSNCLEDYSQCEECNDWTSSEETYCEDDTTLCESCHRDYERSHRYYQPAQHDRYADWTPERQAKSAYPVPLAIEVEGESQYSGRDRYEALETLIDSMTTAAHIKWDDENLNYTTSKSVATSDPDGSLTDRHGFELKTQYLRLETLRTIFNDQTVANAYQDIFNEEDMEGSEAIGLHISFPHSVMTTKSVYRLTAITDYLDNDTYGQEHAKELFGRIPSAYYNNSAKQPVKVAKGDYDGRKTGAIAIRNLSDPKANMSSLSAKYGRVEMRFPRSAWTAKALLARLELAMSLIMWSMEPDPNTYSTAQDIMFLDYLDYHHARLTGSAIKQYRREEAKTN